VKKHILYVVVSALCLYDISIQANDVTGHSYYSIRPEFQSGHPERVSLFRKDRAQAGACGSSFQIVPFGSRSTRAEDLARWFMFGGKSELVAAGFNAFGGPGGTVFDPENTATYHPNARDINPIHFNITRGISTGPLISSPFHSIFTFRPHYTSVGAGVMWRKYFDLAGCFENKLWFEASTALEYVRTNMHMKEQIINPAGVNASNIRNSSMVEAFRGLKPLALGFGDGATADNPPITGQGWSYGKIDGKKSVTKLSDIELKLGYEFFSNCADYFEAYVGVVVPVGRKPTGEFVFEPVVGQHHFGVMFGAAYGVELYHCNDTTYRWEVEYNGRYLFSDTQMRSFDLKNKPWSRYQMVYLTPNALNPSAQFPATEGINIFTQPLKVTAGLAQTLNIALVVQRCAFEWEAGYNVWARQEEKVRLKHPWRSGPGLVRVTVDSDATPVLEITLDDRFIDRDGTIGEVFPPDAPVMVTPATATTIIHESDLDLATAAHPAALSQTVYATVGYNFENCRHPMMVALGASYEFSGVNTALNRWMAWGKWGISL
jgi:hypothetical protein